MHELSVALSIIDGVLEEAERHERASVQTVHLRVGRLSGVDKEALSFSFRVASQDTPLADSRLEIEDVEVLIHCSACDAESTITDAPLLICARCGSVGGRVLQGGELEISKLEIVA